MREASSITLIADLLEAGATVTAYDPVAMDKAQARYAGTPGVGFATTQSTASENADALVIVTAWKEFRSPDFDLVKIKLKTPMIFDRRNLYDPLLIRAMGFEYFAIGRLHAQPASTRPIAVATIPRIVSTQPELAPA